MANELKALAPTGETIYAIVFNSAGQPWNTNTEEHEAYQTANRGDYAIAMTEAGDESGIYYGDLPAGVIADWYAIPYLQAGGSPDEEDPAGVANVWRVGVMGNFRLSL